MKNGKKILFIEDEEFLVEMYQMKFSAEGFEVIIAPDGELGIQLARDTKPDLVFLDMVLPRKNGLEVLAALKGDPETKDLRIFILSNLGQDEEKKKGVVAGAEGYLIKTDLTPADLVVKAKEILGLK